MFFVLAAIPSEAGHPEVDKRRSFQTDKRYRLFGVEERSMGCLEKRAERRKEGNRGGICV